MNGIDFALRRKPKPSNSLAKGSEETTDPVHLQVRKLTMGDQQDFCLRWSSYTQQLSEALRTLLDRELLVDVTLACDGRSIRAHRAVLSACSTYFQELFQESVHPHPIVILKDVRYEELEALVHFMYHGEVTVNHEILQGFLHAAETLHIRGLTDGLHSGQSAGSSKGDSNQPEHTLSDRDDDSLAENDKQPAPKQIKLEPCSSETSYLHQEMDHDGSNEGNLAQNEQHEPRSSVRPDDASSCSLDQFKVQQTITTLDGLSELVLPQTSEDESSSSHFIGQGGQPLRSLSSLGSHIQGTPQIHGLLSIPNNGSGRPFRQRVLYNQEQLLQLETWYRQDRYPSGALMKEYAETLAAMAPPYPGNIGAQPMRQNVDYWFQNRRRKDFHPEVMQQREKKKLAKALWGSYSGSPSTPTTSSNNSNNTAESNSTEK